MREREKLPDATWHPIIGPFKWFSKITDMPQLSSILIFASNKTLKFLNNSPINYVLTPTFEKFSIRPK